MTRRFDAAIAALVASDAIGTPALGMRDGDD
jgi:hypothetical protein